MSKQLLKKLSTIHDLLEGLQVEEELANLDYPDATYIQHQIDTLVDDLGDILPGLLAVNEACRHTPKVKVHTCEICKYPVVVS